MSDFLHYIFPGMSETKERKLAREILTQLKGGEGSGNFGHAGRPGEVGGSATDGDSGGNMNNEVNPNIGNSKDIFGNDAKIFKITDAKNIATESKVIAVCINGNNKGIVLMSPNKIDHSQMVKAVYENDTIDNYVRFDVNSNQLFIGISFAGISDTSDEIGINKAMDNIYKAADRLTGLGMPTTTKMRIDIPYRNTIVTTAKEFIEANS